jgi:rhodanese-related sulfurtransferase
MPNFPMTSPRSVRLALLARTEIALLDVRHESRFAQGHPLFAASFPLGHLEAQAALRLPRRSVPVVVCGDGTDDAAAAAGRLGELGYTDVSLLADGLAGWAADGGELFKDVNAPSKAFGELVAETAGTPSLAADEVAALLRGAGPGGSAAAGPGAAGAAAGSGVAGAVAPVVIVDARRFDEYATMSIPTATSVPGAELALRVRALAPEPGTTVVVNCAGRTRSIIGTQSLINAGLPNRVVALRNGTIGWTLAGFDLDRGQARRAPDVAPETAAEAEAAAWAVADRAGVGRIGRGQPPWRRDGGRTVYRFDVRTPDEYDGGHRPGFRSAPGGQLVQETDWYAPVRGALVVLDGDGGGRAAMTASWLAQMGWDVAVDVDGDDGGDGGDRNAAGPTATAAAEEAGRAAAPDVPLATAAMVADWLQDGRTAVVDVDTSRRYLAGHLPGAAWALRAGLARPELLDRLGRLERLVLTSSDGYLAAWAAADLSASAGPTRVLALAGGTDGWARSGGRLELGQGEMLSPALDVYRRPYEGTDVDPAVMQAYLDWEYGLVGQLGRDGTHGFWVLTG